MKRFNNPKYQKLLIAMKGKEHKIDSLAKLANATTGHLRHVLDDWHNNDIVKIDRKRRDHTVKLTVKGEKISQKCEELWQIIESKEQQVQIKEVENNATTTNSTKTGGK